jgi:hypothetical protein
MNAMRGRWLVRGLQILILLLVVVAGFGQAVLQLWNWLMPSIFGLHAITFWQAVGLMALSWILFGGLRGGRGMSRGWRHGWEGRWARMSPEERERFRKGLEGRSCRPTGPDPVASA